MLEQKNELLMEKEKQNQILLGRIKEKEDQIKKKEDQFKEILMENDEDKKKLLLIIKR